MGGRPFAAARQVSCGLRKSERIVPLSRVSFLSSESVHGEVQHVRDGCPKHWGSVVQSADHSIVLKRRDTDSNRGAAPKTDTQLHVAQLQSHGYKKRVSIELSSAHAH